MDEKQQMMTLLEHMERNIRRQLWLGRLQCLFSFLGAVFCAAAFWMLFRILPQIDTILQQTESILTNLDTTTRQLAGADLTGMISDVDTLVSTAQESLQTTMTKLDAIDLETLSKAISDLAAVVEPLSKISKLFSQ